jgi:flagellar hook-associated protein FlgK
MNPGFSMKRGTRGVFVLALALIVFVAACSKNSNTSNSSSNSSNTASTKPAGSMSPTDTLKAYFEAAKKKDIDGIKKYLSRDSIKLMEDMAKAQGKTLDQMFKENADKDSNMPTPDFSNEKVSGDTATVEAKAPGQPLVVVEMVKEDGAWKVAIDKTAKNAMATQPPPPGPPAPDKDEDNDNSDEHDNGNH